MVWLLTRKLLLCVICVAGIVGARGQNTPVPEPKYAFFAGTVIEVSPDKITVGRTTLGKSPEQRTFIIKADTQIEGKLRSKVRVTVGYATTDEGDVAVRIIVRSSAQKKSSPRELRSHLFQAYLID